MTGGFHQTFWVLAAIALIAPPAVFALTRRSRTGVARVADAEPAVAAGN